MRTMNAKELEDEINRLHARLYYGEMIQELADRIYDLIPSHPGLMEVEHPWELRRLTDLKIDDLDPQPSLMQIRYALATARHRQRAAALELPSARGKEDNAQA